MTHLIDQADWQHFQEEGYLVIRRFLAPDRLAGLQQRIDDIMMGKARLDYSRMLMQLDSDSGKYSDAGPQSKGHKGATLNYRKIQDLEYDKLFLEVMRHPLLEEACRRIHGTDTPISCFRAMFMNKPAKRGTFLPFHQDRWTSLDRDPQLTAWLALDPATKENGCVQIVPGSHKQGLINPEHPSGFLTDEQAADWARPDAILYLELEPGDMALLHNYVIHGSDINRSAQSRRAFSICYLDANTKTAKGEETSFPVIFGEGALALAS